jgi:phosphoglycolate phosphatase
MNVPVPKMEELLWCIGPSLAGSFKKLLPEPTPENIELAIAGYRERFGTIGMFENEVYDGIIPMLERLSKNHDLYIVTAKPHDFARPIAKHFAFAHFFKNIYGSELNGERSDKADLLRYLINKESLKAQDCVMIGDREHDMIAAKAVQMLAVGIAWGYGSKLELESAGADFVVNDVESLEKALA